MRPQDFGYEITKGVRYVVSGNPFFGGDVYISKLFKHFREADVIHNIFVNEPIFGGKVRILKVKGCADPVSDEEVMVWTKDQDLGHLEKIFENRAMADDFLSDTPRCHKKFKIHAFSKEVVKDYESRA